MKKVFPYLLVIALLLPSVAPLFGKGYFSMHDDLQVMRIFQMEKCFDDGQIPCRWSPDMAFGYGQAMFNFYSVFPYYLGVLIRLVFPISIMATVKLLFIISVIAAACGMYLLASQFWGKMGGILSSVLYTYAPYHALNIFVRGAMAEGFALAVLPYVWLAIYLLVKRASFKRILMLSLAIAILFTSHNITSLIFAPFTILWAVFWIIYSRNIKSIVNIGIAGILGIGVSAFFVIPNLFEQSLIQKEFFNTDYFFYGAHFVSLKQLFWERSWGYGPSIFGPNDEISFAVGWPHWWIGLPLGVIVISWFRIKRRRLLSLILFVLISFLTISTFMTHGRSTFIWKLIPLISFVQFPWRFLGLTAFSLSFAAGALAKAKFRFKKLIVFIMLVLIIVLNIGYFKSEYSWWWATDEEKLSGVAFELQQKAAVLDYLPKTAKNAPKEIAPENPQVISGEGRAYNFSKNTNSFFFDAELYGDAELQIPVMYFPGWVVISDGELVASRPSEEIGAITVNLTTGKHIVQGRFINTPIRSLSNVVTVVSLMLIFVGYVFDNNKRKFLWV